MLKYKHVQAAHEIRMWAMTLLTFGVVGNQILKSHPEVKDAICRPIRSIRNKLKKDDKPRVIEVRVIDERES